ncbi:MAG: hypothetical protein F8N36_14285 [Desulfovibrio sp.]|uniref:hypothetical protein n=1 Tax=Desulfovibrio sp. TaxID=885 RepID=UPI00135D1EBE|nr:hypothetical protein [Desulfovibrio sp.]MTJ94007.1 hypothetical protein [Desulfovibrio sp.]
MTKWRTDNASVDWTHLVVRILLMGVAGIVMAPRIMPVYDFIVDHAQLFYAVGPVLFFGGLLGQKGSG